MASQGLRHDQRRTTDHREREREAATSKADPTHQQDWFLKGLQGEATHPLATLWGGDSLLLCCSAGAAGARNPMRAEAMRAEAMRT
jgi:hypothetical protein